MSLSKAKSSALYRAKNAYWLWTRRAIKVEGFGLSITGYKFYDRDTEITIYLKYNGSYTPDPFKRK